MGVVIPSEVLKLIDQSKRFSPLLLSCKLHIDLQMGAEMCEFLYEQNPTVYRKWFRIICPGCASIAFTDSFSRLEQLVEANCPECLENFRINSDHIEIYYTNEKYRNSAHLSIDGVQKYVKKVGKQNSAHMTHFIVGASRSSEKEAQSVSDSEDFAEIPLNILNSKQEISEDFLKQNRDLLWQISDLHFHKKSWISFFRPGHSVRLIDNFIRMLSLRGELLPRDVVVISGDVTDTGSREDIALFEEFLQRLELLGVRRERILIVPGNHDSWHGASAIRMCLSYFRREKSILQKHGHYQDRKYQNIFSQFDEKSSVINSFNMNGRQVEIVLINTAVSGEMARGVFPVDVQRIRSTNGLKILVMHHHLVEPEASDFKYGFAYSREAKALRNIRVLNASVGLQYLTENRVQVSLHGHKHVQYFKYESSVNTYGHHTLISSCPSLSENNFDDVRGNCSGKNMIGFNVIIPGAKRSILCQFKLVGWRFSLQFPVPF